MLKSTHLFIVHFILAFATNAHASKLIIGKVIGVTDGDTIKVLENHTLYKIRLYDPQTFGNAENHWRCGTFLSTSETRNHDPPPSSDAHIPSIETELIYDGTYSQLPPINYWTQ